MNSLKEQQALAIPLNLSKLLSLRATDKQSHMWGNNESRKDRGGERKRERKEGFVRAQGGV